MNVIKIYIACLLFSYYSMYGHVEKLAEEIKKGAASVEGVEAKLWQVCTSFRVINLSLEHLWSVISHLSKICLQ